MKKSEILRRALKLTEEWYKLDLKQVQKGQKDGRATPIASANLIKHTEELDKLRELVEMQEWLEAIEEEDVWEE